MAKKKKTAIRKLLNTTVYNGKDVVAIISAVVSDNGRKKDWDRIKVRYLKKPVEGHKGLTEDGLLWARAEKPYGTKVLTVALLEPNKINVLDALARVGDGFAHERIVQDLIASMEGFYYSGGDTTDETRALQIRLLAAADADEKLRSAHENLIRDYSSRADTLIGNKSKLDRAQKTVARLSKLIPEDEKKLATVKARLDRATDRMKDAGLL